MALWSRIEGFDPAVGSLLVDGFYRASWSLQLKKGAATLAIHGFKGLPSDPRNVVDEIEAEGAGLLELRQRS